MGRLSITECWFAKKALPMCFDLWYCKDRILHICDRSLVLQDSDCPLGELSFRWLLLASNLFSVSVFSLIFMLSALSLKGAATPQVISILNAVLLKLRGDLNDVKKDVLNTSYWEYWDGCCKLPVSFSTGSAVATWFPGLRSTAKWPDG